MPIDNPFAKPVNPFTKPSDSTVVADSTAAVEAPAIETRQDEEKPKEVVKPRVETDRERLLKKYNYIESDIPVSPGIR